MRKRKRLRLKCALMVVPVSRALLHGDSVESVQSASLRDFKLSERLKAIHPAGDVSHDVYTAASGKYPF